MSPGSVFPGVWLLKAGWEGSEDCGGPALSRHWEIAVRAIVLGDCRFWGKSKCSAEIPAVHPRSVWGGLSTVGHRESEELSGIPRARNPIGARPETTGASPNRSSNTGME